MNKELTQAEGFLLLGMLNEAWDETEALPPPDRVEPVVLELRLRILTLKEAWELGGHIANVLVSSAIETRKCRETAAQFYWRHARALCREGKHEEAREAIRAASQAWPDLRIEIVHDKTLERALNGDP